MYKKKMANGLVVYLYNVTLSTQIQASLTHKSFSVPQQFLPTIHTLRLQWMHWG